MPSARAHKVPSGKGSPGEDFASRSKRWSTGRDEGLHRRRAAQAAKELELCTFSPELNARSLRISAVRTAATGEQPAGSSARRARLPVPMTSPSPHPPADVATHAQREPAEAALAMSDDDRFNTLPLELQLHIANAVSERCDRAALALASPRLLGLAAGRELPSYQGLEMSLAFHHVLGGAIDEQLLRMYARRSEATPEGCKWLAGVDAGAGVLVVSGNSAPQWHLKSGSTVGALLRSKLTAQSALEAHYEGEEGAERLVCCEEPDGSVWHFEGKKGMERRVRFVPANGGVWHYTGKKGARRLVRSKVFHFEGEGGAEHIVRCEPSACSHRHCPLHGSTRARREATSNLCATSHPTAYGGVIHLGSETDAE